MALASTDYSAAKGSFFSAALNWLENAGKEVGKARALSALEQISDGQLETAGITRAELVARIKAV